MYPPISQLSMFAQYMQEKLLRMRLLGGTNKCDLVLLAVSYLHYRKIVRKMRSGVWALSQFMTHIPHILSTSG